MNFIKKIIINVKNVIKKIDKFFDNIIIWLFLTIISVGIVAIFVNSSHSGAGMAYPYIRLIAVNSCGES